MAKGVNLTRNNNKGPNRGPVRTQLKTTGGIKKRLSLRPGVPDARQRIIQKKRKHVVDARDILARKGKTQDARSKLLKLRERGKGGMNGSIRPIGANILRKTDPNGKISLVTNKSRQSATMNLKIQEQLGLVLPQRKKVMVKRPVKHDYNSPLLRKTIRNDYSSPVMPHYGYDHPEMYRYMYAGVSPLLAPIEMRRPIMDIPMTRSILTEAAGDWKYGKMRPNGYIDLDAVTDEEMPLLSSVRPGMTRMSNIHSRLDAKPVASASHGILSSAPKFKVGIPKGHRIVVSNLQSTVTQDDIRELFEDIGQLLVARLVRPGTAEVIYEDLKDAQKAVDTYHNRQLDGQPMKCLLVNKRPLNNPTAPAIKTSSESVLPTRESSNASSNKLVPDISTIHKVLFQRK